MEILRRIQFTTKGDGDIGQEPRRISLHGWAFG
jgi:hypothetical protein